jgi:hypothetical protein
MAVVAFDNEQQLRNTTHQLASKDDE